MKRSYIQRKVPLKRTALRRKAKKKSKLPKTRLWSTKKADTVFSMMVRERDGRCLFPGCTVREIAKLQCSHYIGRGTSATRFDPDNCIALCWLHHFKDKMLGYEYQKQREDTQGWDGQYTKFMRDWLGEERFNALIARSKTSVKRSSSIVTLMALSTGNS